MTVLSLFDGMSCGQIALERAGIKVDKYYSCEIDKYAIQVTQKNYPDTIQLGDVCGVDFARLKNIDIVIGGSPCTYWSIAQKNRETTSSGVGFDLFMQFVRAVRETKCKYFLYENNFSIHKDIQNAISKELGVSPIMINSALVSAQSRKRLYWTNIPRVTLPADKNIFLKDVLVDCRVCEIPLTNDNLEKIKSNCIRVGGSGSGLKDKHNWDTIRIGQIGKGGQGQRIYSINVKSVNLTAGGGGQGANTGLYLISEIVRKLTPIECERLQTVPDNYTAGVSNTQRYKMLGNGWTVDVIAHIFRGLKNEIV